MEPRLDVPPPGRRRSMTGASWSCGTILVVLVVLVVLVGRAGAAPRPTRARGGGSNQGFCAAAGRTTTPRGCARRRRRRGVGVTSSPRAAAAFEGDRCRRDSLRRPSTLGACYRATTRPEDRVTPGIDAPQRRPDADERPREPQPVRQAHEGNTSTPLFPAWRPLKK